MAPLFASWGTKRGTKHQNWLLTRLSSKTLPPGYGFPTDYLSRQVTRNFRGLPQAHEPYRPSPVRTESQVGAASSAWFSPVLAAVVATIDSRPRHGILDAAGGVRFFRAVPHGHLFFR